MSDMNDTACGRLLVFRVNSAGGSVPSVDRGRLSDERVDYHLVSEIDTGLSVT